MSFPLYDRQTCVIHVLLHLKPHLFLLPVKRLQADFLLILKKAYALGTGEQPSPTCVFDVDSGVGTRRDYIFARHHALLSVGSGRILLSMLPLRSELGLLRFSLPGMSLLALLAGVQQPIVLVPHFQKRCKGVWFFFFHETLHVVPLEVRETLVRYRHAGPDVNLAWNAWCTAAEEGLFTAYDATGGTQPQSERPFQGRGTVEFRTRLVGGLLGGFTVLQGRCGKLSFLH